MIDIACVGVIVADAIARPVKIIPSKGKLELVDTLSLYSGGCAASAAIAMAKIGIKAAIIGKIGDDGFGNFIINAFIENKVITDGLIVKKGGATSASLVMVTEDAERSFIHCQGENATLVESDIDYDLIEKAKLVFVAGFMLMQQFDGDECAKFLKKCKEMGKMTALDTAWDSTGRWMTVMASSLPFLDYFLPSFEEAVELSGKTDPEEIADVFLALGPKVVVIKLGKDGCFIKTQAGEKHLIPTYDKIKPVDTTGAGDSFCAGFLTAAVKEKNLFECGQFGNAVGTHCVMARGASTGIKPEAEIREFMEKYQKEHN